MLGYIVAKACASPRNSTWFTRPVHQTVSPRERVGSGDKTNETQRGLKAGIYEAGIYEAGIYEAGIYEAGIYEALYPGCS